MGNNFTPAWIKKGFFNESLFCDDFLSTHQLLYVNGAFFTPEGRVTDTMNLRCEIFDMLRDHIGANIAKRVSNVVDVLKLAAQVEDFPPVTDRIALANGTLYLDGTFQEGKPEIVRNRLPVRYDPKAPQPTHWLRFLSDLLYPEDIPTVQEFIGYCLIPSNKGQRMMVIKGSGGEGKSQIGVVLSRLFGCNMKDGSIGKISENRFARADLEHTLLCVDDDMRMEALRQTNYVKSIVTAQGQMDLERKGKQSYQGWMYARLLAFSNGDLQALYDRSDGFYRRQLILTTKDKPLSRVDDPDIAEKMAAEVEGILLWAFEGLQRLVKNGFQFTESDRAKRNRELVKRDNNNVFDFLESEGYIRLKADACTSSKELYEVYRMWCAMMVGREVSNLYPTREESQGEDVLRVTNLSGGVFKDVNFHVCAGEIVGFAGLVGAGRTEIVRAVCGFDPITSGTVEVSGAQLKPVSISNAIKKGLVMASEDRRKYGIVGTRSIKENISLPNLKNLSKGGIVQKAKEKSAVQTYFDRLRIKAGSQNVPTYTLSGGNQQKVVLAKWLMASPKVLILDEPTRGIDVGAKYEIYEIMNELAQQGMGVVMISSELPELIGMCKRIYVVAEGRITGELKGDEITQESVMTYATGGK